METQEELEIKEAEKEYLEYLKRKELEDLDEEDFKELNTGIRAIDKTYLFDKRVEKLVNIFEKSIAYIKTHTDLTEEEIKNRINQTIFQIEFKEGYEDHPTGIGYVDYMFHILSMNINVLERETEEIYEFVKHEVTHMMGLNIIKRLFKTPLQASGYSRENIFDLKNEAQNEYFNEAAVEMFVSQDEDYREEKVLDYTINTNQDLNGGLYCLNSNLIHQMLIAKGVEEKDFFQGLYDFEKSKQIMSKLKKSVFKNLSLNMDDISEELMDYYFAELEADRLKENNLLIEAEEKQEEAKEHKLNVESIISQSEKMIIDKILLPRLKKLPSIEQQKILMEYDKFIISEREYFQAKTGYKAVMVKKEQKEPWLEHVNIELSANENNVNKNLKEKELDSKIKTHEAR